MGYSIAYNSGTTTPFGTYKQGTITMGLKPDEYTVSSGFTWYANAEYTNDAYLIISDTYSQGWSTQAEAKPTIWRSETGTTESFVSLVNQLPDVNGVTGFTNGGNAMAYLQNSGKYFVSKDNYLGIVTDGLVLNLDAGWYPSYSGSGTTWKDLKGTNNGTLINGPTFSNGAIVFDGVNDYVYIAGPNSGPLNTIGTGNFTINVWASNTGSSAYRWFLSNWLNTGMHMGMNSVNRYFGGYFGDNDELRTDYSIPTDGSWHFYTATRTSGNIKCFVDGIERTIIYGNPTNKTNSLSSGTDTKIGTRGDVTTQQWLGNVGIEQIYNRALSSTEITQNYNATKGRFGL